MESETKLTFDDSFVLQHQDNTYFYFRVNPSMNGKGYPVNSDVLVRVRKSDYKVHGPDLVRSISNGAKTFLDFLADKRVMKYARQLGEDANPESFYFTKINGNVHRVSRVVMEKCDCDGPETTPVWIHCLMAQKLAEWLDSSSLVFAFCLVDKLKEMNRNLRLDDPLCKIDYHMGLQAVTEASAKEATAESNGSTSRSIRHQSSLCKRTYAPSPEDNERRIKARIEEKQAELRIAEMEKESEIRRREMQIRSDLNIKAMERSEQCWATLVDDGMRQRRFLHVLDMIQLFARAEDGPGPVSMDAAEADRCSALCKSLFFDAFGNGADIVQSSQTF
eukprot:jgi/Mesvir1/21633/Mv04055-RA.1